MKEFSTQTGIPLSTLNTAFHKRIEGSSYELVRRICSILHIRHIYDDEITYVNGEFYDLVKSVESLGEQGLGMVKALMRYEAERCGGVNKGVNGIGHVEKTDEHIKSVNRKVLEEEKGTT